MAKASWSQERPVARPATGGILNGGRSLINRIVTSAMAAIGRSLAEARAGMSFPAETSVGGPRRGKNRRRISKLDGLLSTGFLPHCERPFQVFEKARRMRFAHWTVKLENRAGFLYKGPLIPATNVVQFV
ncbi:hypothetical protein [Aquibium sp. ELW1220]|uniref:hypothetical protein n=1 Tax=Aquibium sp. ELW1220 TaxID=2976766 RepID=UPI0025B26846|nr:hypothetical protein [Aquibium sp. ELW1220]MDN2581299.1 hypothetical protein [Aquibium sp. ELW1220]